MKILILHGIDAVEGMRRTSLHHAFFLPRHAPEHDYWLHAASSPVTDTLLREDFDAIIIETTFLCWRWGRPAELYAEVVKRKYDFLRDSKAVKIAFPQDDFDHSGVLDAWLSDWNVDVVYTPCYVDRETLYPRTSQQAEIRFGHTGFVEPEDLAIVARFALPWRERRIDVGYRGKRQPIWFGRFGLLKAEFADNFVAAADGTGLMLDISNELKDTFYGDYWLRFLGQCRFVLGCETGGSVLDRYGDIRERCDAYIAKHPDAGFDEIEAACFPGLDRAVPVKAISPRLFEAAAAGCAQILAPGDYSGILEPWEHYLPLEPDMSNLGDILDAMRDEGKMAAMIKASRDALLFDPRLTYGAYTTDVLEAVTSRRPGLRIPEPMETVDALLRLALQTGERWSAAWPRWWQSR